MSKTYILYNPRAGAGSVINAAETLALTKDEAILIDVTKTEDYSKLFSGFNAEDDVVLCGGDGTLNRFANDTAELEYNFDLYYYATGSGNDFARDLSKEKGAEPDYKVNGYLTDLPSVKVDCLDEEKCFLNGVGYGIDGYCCEKGDELHAENEKNGTDKPINYTSIAIKGLLFDYKPTSAIVTVDGKKYSYKKVWIAPTMNGRYYGGGMMPAPEQKRLCGDGEEKKLTLMVFHGSSKLKTLMIFPSLFKGEHVRHKKHVEILTGSEITVEFDSPRPLQIDGETVLGVRSYTAYAKGKARVRVKEKEFEEAEAQI